MTTAVQKVRRTAAEARQAEREKRSPQQQLSQLDKLYGPGKGAVRERARLAAQIAAPPKPADQIK